MGLFDKLKIDDLYKLAVIGLIIAILVETVKKYNKKEGYNRMRRYAEIKKSPYHKYPPTSKLTLDSDEVYDNRIDVNAGNFFGFHSSSRRDVNIEKNKPGPSCNITQTREPEHEAAQIAFIGISDIEASPNQ